jgi:hypothetical protein
MDSIIADTQSGVAAIAPTTDTAAGKAQLLAHLRTQLNRAQAVVQSARQTDAALSGQIQAAIAAATTGIV